MSIALSDRKQVGCRDTVLLVIDSHPLTIDNTVTRPVDHGGRNCTKTEPQPQLSWNKENRLPVRAIQPLALRVLDRRHFLFLNLPNE